VPQVEAKFLIQSPEQFQEVLRAIETLGYTVTKGPTETLIDRYFDTPDCSILRAGWSFRCRERDGHQELTLEAVGSMQAPVFLREEINQPLSEEVPGGSGELPRGPVQERLSAIVNGLRRRELFRIRNRRTVYTAKASGTGSTLAKLGFDRTQIRARGAAKTAPGSLDFSEVELELRAGEAEEVEHLAKVLRDQVGLVPARLSKFERGMQAAGLQTSAEQAPAPASELRADGRILTLVYHHLDVQLRALKLQQPRAWEGLDPEGVHQMRVAIRRIRSVLRAFRDMLREDTFAHLTTEFRWLARTLGDVRDADVYGKAFHRCRESLPEEIARALAPYEQHLENMSAAARAALTDALASERYVDLVEHLESFVEAGPSMAVLRRFGSVRISDGADLYIRPAVKRMLKLGRSVKAGSPATRLHKLRIEGKRLRYLLEFFSDVESKRWARPLKAARRLQDVLGEHQDACTARERLEAYAQSVALRRGARESLLALGRLLQREEERVVKSRKRFPRAWARFEKGIVAG